MKRVVKYKRSCKSGGVVEGLWGGGKYGGLVERVVG